MKALLIAVLAGLCWGIGESFTKSVLHGGKIGPLTAMAVRTTVALPLLWLAAIWAMRAATGEPRDWFKADLATLAKLVLGSGVTAGAAAMLLFYFALSLSDISRIKPVAFATAIAAAVAIGWLVFREPMSPQRLLAVLLIIAGIVLMVGR